MLIIITYAYDEYVYILFCNNCALPTYLQMGLNILFTLISELHRIALNFIINFSNIDLTRATPTQYKLISPGCLFIYNTGQTICDGWPHIIIIVSMGL